MVTFEYLDRLHVEAIKEIQAEEDKANLRVLAEGTKQWKEQLEEDRIANKSW